MATKINLPQLAKILAQKKNLSQKDAEAFLREFFETIIDNVSADKLVKVKGLGTFKLIEVLDRESVNVNTGERIIIPGHSKLSFTPETALKELINKPFADFQTVIINEGTSIEDMEWVPDSAQSSQTPMTEEAEQEETDEETTAEAPVQKLVEEPIPEPAEEPESAEDTKQEQVHVSEPEQISELKAEPKPETQEPVKQETLSSERKEGGNYWPWILGLLLLCVIAFFAYRTLSAPQAKENTEQVAEPQEQEPQAKEPQIEEPVEEAPASEEVVEYAQVEGGEYKIIGTRKTHVMKSGDYLTKIAIDEYGNKYMVQYIIVHNNFPNPDNIPIGAEIKLPELEKKE